MACSPAACPQPMSNGQRPPTLQASGFAFESLPEVDSSAHWQIFVPPQPLPDHSIRSSVMSLGRWMSPHAACVQKHARQEDRRSLSGCSQVWAQEGCHWLGASFSMHCQPPALALDSPRASSMTDRSPGASPSLRRFVHRAHQCHRSSAPSLTPRQTLRDFAGQMLLAPSAFVPITRVRQSLAPTNRRRLPCHRLLAQARLMQSKLSSDPFAHPSSSDPLFR